MTVYLLGLRSLPGNESALPKVLYMESDGNATAKVLISAVNAAAETLIFSGDKVT